MPALEKLENGTSCEGPLCCIVLDGFGIGKKDEGDCVHLANPPFIYSLYEESKKKGLYCDLKAHGTAVGLPDDTDMGNSEVGHNAIGCGQIVAQGAKLVNQVLEDGSIFESPNWKEITHQLVGTGKCLHLLGLLSDGNIHSHIAHLEKITSACKEAGVDKVRYHILTDGRDVGSMSALEYVDRIENHINTLAMQDKYKLASGGGRMYMTMDRYEADWDIVKRGWDAMVHGKVCPDTVKECGEGYEGFFSSTTEAVESVRKMFPKKTDQDYPPWVIVDADKQAIGKVCDGDVVINMNFRGDRALEISRAFDNSDGADFDTKAFNRAALGPIPNDVKFYGMLIYDNDKGIPRKSLAPNPDIKNVLSGYLCASGVTQYAVAETHKFGHVTFFWNGNRSEMIDASLEKYEQVKSEPLEMITSNPCMKNPEVTAATKAAIDSGDFKFVRVNFATGDMVGHTGLIPQTIETVQSLDKSVKELVEAVSAKNGITVITADHGNCEDMLDKKGNVKTSHSLNAVPFIVVDPNCNGRYTIDSEQGRTCDEPAGLANVAATLCNLLGFKQPQEYCTSLVKFT